jgi:hypothetical protein
MLGHQFVPSLLFPTIIGSRHKFAGGNWETYASQKNFEWKIDHRLSSYVIPPELDSAVLIFSRDPN